jgi:hypothetical protein
VQTPRFRERERQLAHRPRDADVAESTLFLHATRFFGRHAVRKQAFFQAAMNTIGTRDLSPCAASSTAHSCHRRRLVITALERG